MTTQITSKENIVNEFKEIYEQLYKMVNGILKDAETSKDVLQETVVNILYNNNLNIKNVQAYLVTSCRYNAYLTLKSQKNKPIFIDITDLDFIEDIETIYFEEETTTFNKHIKLFYDIINNLTPKQKEVILLKLKGLRRDEISKIMGISNNSIKVHLTIAYEKIKNNFNFKDFKRSI